MKIYYDYNKIKIRLTEERLRHILEHPEMVGQEMKIEEVLRYPEIVIQSLSDERAKMYYRYYQKLVIGDKYLCVAVKFRDNDAFIVTAYFTDQVKKGVILWKE